MSGHVTSGTPTTHHRTVSAHEDEPPAVVHGARTSGPRSKPRERSPRSVIDAAAAEFLNDVDAAYEAGDENTLSVILGRERADRNRLELVAAASEALRKLQDRPMPVRLGEVPWRPEA